MGVGVVNRFDGDKRMRYPFRRALDDLGATYMPVVVRDLRARVGHDGLRLTIEPDSDKDKVLSAALHLDGVLWHVSENTFNEYGSLIELIARDFR